MMIIVALVLFIGGMWLMGISFSLTDWEALVFVGGLLAVSAALALPIHATRREIGIGENREI